MAKGLSKNSKANSKTARLWLRQANLDVDAGRLLYSNEMPAHALFFAQDAFEKALKGTLLHFGVAIKKDHLFKKLYRQTRYPEAHCNQHAPSDVIDLDTAKIMLDLADAALKAGEKLLELDPVAIRKAWSDWASDPIAVKETVEKSLEVLESYQAGLKGPSGP